MRTSMRPYIADYRLPKKSEAEWDHPAPPSPTTFRPEGKHDANHELEGSRASSQRDNSVVYASTFTRGNVQTRKRESTGERVFWKISK